MGVVECFDAPRKAEPADDFTEFSCGVQIVDDWAHVYASRAEKQGTAVVYVSMCDNIIAGFYSLSAHSVCRDDVKGGWLRRNAPTSIPVILLGMLGVDDRFQGKGLGKSLLGDAVNRALIAAAQIGAKALIVDPIDSAARAFYEKYGFKPIPSTDRLFVPLKLT